MKKNCPICESTQISKDGKYRRSNDSRIIQRLRCKCCGKRFSHATGTLEFRHKKRRISPLLFKLFASGVSQRRAAQILGVHRVTVARKFKYLAQKSRKKNETLQCRAQNIQFDDLITKENSKLKPLSVSLAVDSDTRYILSAEVSKIRAFGHLSKKGRSKYPERGNEHKAGLERMFKKLLSCVDERASIRSDEHRFYPEFVARYFPKSSYQQFKSERACIVGQGELKRPRLDPLFCINHTCAMLRANINRLFRKTWCTTKDPRRLKDHLDIFICFYNFDYLKAPPYK